MAVFSTTFAPRRAYEDFLALVAHEYFHVWNVKRIRPEVLLDYDLEVSGSDLVESETTRRLRELGAVVKFVDNPAYPMDDYYTTPAFSFSMPSTIVGMVRFCVPCWTMRWYFSAASITRRPSTMLWLPGFSQ